MSARAAEPAAPPEQSSDAFLLKGLLVLLLISFSVFRLHLVLDEGYRYQSIYYMDLPVVCLLSLFALGHRLLDSRPLAVRLGVFFPVFLLTLWWFFSGLLQARQPGFFAVSILQYVSGCLVLLSLPRMLVRYGLVSFTMDAFLACAMVVAAIALVFALVHPERAFANITSILNPNRAHIGIYMLVALTVALYRAQRTRREFLYLTMAFLCFVVILISGSRAALVGCVLVLAAYFLRRLTFANFIKFAVAGALLAGVFYYIMQEREGVARSTEAAKFEVSDGVTVDQSAGRRLLMWYVSWKTIRSSNDVFWRGVGFTNFRFEYDRVVKLPFYTNGAHNAYLHVWTESGLIGLLLYLSIFACLIGYVIRHRKRDPALLLMAGMVLGICFTGMTQETMFPNESQSNFNVLFFLMTLLMVIDSQLRLREKDTALKAGS